MTAKAMPRTWRMVAPPHLGVCLNRGSGFQGRALNRQCSRAATVRPLLRIQL